MPQYTMYNGPMVTTTGPTPVVQWRMVSGPGTVTFGNASALATIATFSRAGTYVLRLRASAGARSGAGGIPCGTSMRRGRTRSWAPTTN